MKCLLKEENFHYPEMLTYGWYDPRVDNISDPGGSVIVVASLDKEITPDTIYDTFLVDIQGDQLVLKSTNIPVYNPLYWRKAPFIIFTN